MVPKPKPRPRAERPANGYQVQRRPLGYVKITGAKPTKATRVFRPSSWVRVQVVGRRANVNGIPTRIYTLGDLALLWKGDVTEAMTRRWYRQGILPRPYFHKALPQGGNQPLWIREQVKLIHEIINAHWGKFRNLRRRHLVTTRLLHEHSDAAKDRFIDKIVRTKQRQRVSKAGVEWIDRPNVANRRLDRGNSKVVLREPATIFFDDDDLE